GYMRKQEFGGFKRGGGKHGAPIRTGYAAGQPGAKPPTRMVRGPNKLTAIKLKRAPRRGGRKQRNAIAMAKARKAGARFVFLELERKKGIFRLLGSKSRPQLRMVHDLSFRTVRIPKTPTLQRTLKRMDRKLPTI